MRGDMSPEQAKAYDDILASVSALEPAAYYIDGPGGSGKTFLYQALLANVRGQKLPALACAWSGIAAVLLERGRTCHSRFGLTVPLSEQSTIGAQTDKAEVLRQARLILWDEAPMAPKDALETIDALLRDLAGALFQAAHPRPPVIVG